MRKLREPGRRARATAEAELRASDWLSRIPVPIQDKLVARARWRLLARGQNLLLAGEDVGGLFGVGQGSIYTHGEMAPADIVMSDLHRAPFWFLTQTMLPGERTRINVVAQEPIVCMYVPRGPMWQTMQEHPELQQHLFRHVAGPFHAMGRALADALIRDTDQRCIAVLVRIAGCGPGQTAEIVVPVGQIDLAGMANVSRQKIGEVLRALEAEGIIALGYRKIRVIDPPRLLALRPTA